MESHLLTAGIHTYMGFIKVDEKSGEVVVKVNARVFPIDLIYQAAYSLMDRAYVILDGDPEDTVYVIMKPRNYEGSLEELGRMLYDELLNFAFYAVQSVRNRGIREALLKAVAPKEEEDFEEIAELWEEKFGEADEGDDETE